jgi:hypothetical protein
MALRAEILRPTEKLAPIRGREMLLFVSWYDYFEKANGVPKRVLYLKKIPEIESAFRATKKMCLLYRISRIQVTGSLATSFGSRIRFH